MQPTSPNALSYALGVTRGCSVIALLGGLITFLGWTFDIPRITDWAGTGISMLPNTSIAMMLAGAALLLWSYGHVGATRVLGILVGLIGAATLFQYVSSIDLGIDRLVVYREWGQRGTLVPGRMGPPAGTSFTLLGIALVWGAVGGKGSGRASVLAIISFCIAALSLTGYAFGADPLFSLPRFTTIALQTSMLLATLSIGILASLPTTQPVQGLLEDSSSGLILRRGLPVVVVLPLALAWLRLQGQEAGWYDTAFGTALRTTVEIGLLVAALWWVASLTRSHERFQRASQQALRLKTDELEGFLDTAAICLHRVGPDGIILWANQAELDTLGYTAEEYIGRHIAEFHADAAVIADILRRLHAGEKLRNVEARMRCKDGSVRHVLIDSSVLWVNEHFKHTRCFTRDVTEQKLAEGELRLANKRKDEFLATLAHELRNPLAPINNGLELLNAGPEPDKAGLQAMMKRQMRQMTRLVDDLLDVSRVNQGKIVLRMAPVELASLIHQAVESVKPQVENAHQDLKVVLPLAPMYVHGDGPRLVQAIGNLLNNASKFTPLKGSIELRLAEEQGQACIRISDTGIGLEPEEMDRIFELFVQADTSLERTTSGLGIGLTLTKNLTELHQGTVEVASPGRGMGSTFTLRYPLCEPPATTSRPVERPLTEGSVSHSILIVDDNKDAADSMALLMKALGHTVHLAHDGPSAIAAATRLLPRIILLDIGLPHMNGYEVAQSIRAEAWGKDTVLIALTGWGQDEDKRRSKEAGFDHHLVKPPMLADLKRIIAHTPPVAMA
jgi:PAS domain S-box-containing protein